MGRPAQFGGVAADDQTMSDSRSPSAVDQPRPSATLMHALIVDDDEFVREIARLSLEFIGGWAVSVASDGTEGIEQARNLSPDVILLDLVMPGIGGLATLRDLSDDARTSHIPVIFLTAKAQAGDQPVGESSARGLIAKPFDPLSLAHDIEVILSAT
jgi:two-component system OmpR family response regulator